MGELNLTVEQYHRYKKKGMRDADILERLHYSPVYQEKLTEWKRRNNIEIGYSKGFAKDLDKIKKLRSRGYSYEKVGRLLGVSGSRIHKWLQEEKNEMSSV